MAVGKLDEAANMGEKTNDTALMSSPREKSTRKKGSENHRRDEVGRLIFRPLFFYDVNE